MTQSCPVPQCASVEQATQALLTQWLLEHSASAVHSTQALPTQWLLEHSVLAVQTRQIPLMQCDMLEGHGLDVPHDITASP
jgi:hypothetical protein